jgi:predicted RNase H-like HicB family nuclease/DNA-binding XRE family transcriptional regulator
VEERLMQYPAVVSREGGVFLIEFPDCPGCQTFARSAAEVEARGGAALEGWLEVNLEDGGAPPVPSIRRQAPKDADLVRIPVSTQLAAAIEIRWARRDARLSQAALGKRIGVSQQAIAKLEGGKSNVSLDTLEKVARGLGRAVELRFT